MVKVNYKGKDYNLDQVSEMDKRNLENMSYKQLMDKIAIYCSMTDEQMAQLPVRELQLHVLALDIAFNYLMLGMNGLYSKFKDFSDNLSTIC